MSTSFRAPAPASLVIEKMKDIFFFPDESQDGMRKLNGLWGQANLSVKADFSIY